MKKTTILNKGWHCLVIIALGCTLIQSSCKKPLNGPSADSQQHVGNDDVSILSACTTGCWLGATNQANNMLELYSYYADWSVSTARTWSYIPTTGNGFTSTEVGKWGTPNDFKIREVPSWGSGNYVAAIGNGGLVTIIDYSTDKKRWAVTVGGSSTDNIHAVELLPNGNIAVAASAGGWVKIWGSSNGGTTSYTYSLPDAHGVLWDPAYNTLWAWGRKLLVALKVGGTAASPTLSASATYTLPSDDYGHSIAAKYGNINQLYLSSSNHVWIFDKVAHTFTIAPGYIDRNAVKAISNQPDGVVILTRPDNIKTPVPSEPSTINTGWTTTYVDYYSATGTYLGSGHRKGAAYYKGFVYNTLYQTPAATLANGKYIITSRLSGKAAVVSGASTTVGAKVIEYDYTDSNAANDQWLVEQIGSTGYYKITNVNSGLAMVTEGASYNNTADVIQHTYTDDGTRNDEWFIVPVGNGYYSLVNRRSNKVLNVEGAVQDNGTQLIQYDYSDVPQCQWQFVAVP